MAQAIVPENHSLKPTPLHVARYDRLKLYLELNDTIFKEKTYTHLKTLTREKIKDYYNRVNLITNMIDDFRANEEVDAPLATICYYISLSTKTYICKFLNEKGLIDIII